MVEILEVASRFGRIRNKKLKLEAQKCTKAIKNYVEYDVDYDKYYNNYIEIMARKAEQKALKQYYKEGQEIRRSFPYIPQELL